MEAICEAWERISGLGLVGELRIVETRASMRFTRVSV